MARYQNLTDRGADIIRRRREGNGPDHLGGCYRGGAGRAGAVIETENTARRRLSEYVQQEFYECHARGVREEEKKAVEIINKPGAARPNIKDSVFVNLYLRGNITRVAPRSQPTVNMT
ncbi:hypothetical protein EVAR_81170_1 [Eumeta japonica]|uniref:Uncharacterized protein n=1 Tax=Eumeta variegata TaxID=151549 RepID=A0A4C1UK52_EUMVA|nr:hypothetical protein EVAR_81170_1 [Eumeta japonica]